MPALCFCLKFIGLVIPVFTVILYSSKTFWTAATK